MTREQAARMALISLGHTRPHLQFRKYIMNTMNVSNTQENSEQALMQSIFTFSDAGGSVIQIKTREQLRAAMVLRKSLILPPKQGGAVESTYKEWDITNGWREFTGENYTDNTLTGDSMDFGMAIQRPITDWRNTSSDVRTKPQTVHYYAFMNPHSHVADNAFVVEFLMQYATILPQTNICILLITPEVAIDSLPVGTVLVAEMKTPNVVELSQVLRNMLKGAAADYDAVEIDDTDIQAIARIGLGLTLHEFETHCAIAQIEASLNKVGTLTAAHMIAGVSKGKTEVVNQSEILELYPSDSMENVGGMERLKDWINSRANCYSDEAREFGVQPPSGMGLVGVPGSGKSLIAKAVASSLNVPLVRMDFARVFSKFIGDSESRVRQALSMVEEMAPCVLFVDEIDKGLGGIGGGGGDSGTSSRVLGSFLTWLQDHVAPVFVMVTANDITNLPPELLRKGRLDAIFSVGLPTPAERREVLAIHLRKRERNIDDFPAEEVEEVVTTSDRYVPAEIESAVKDGLISAFNEGVPLEMRHVTHALREMVPLSTSSAAKINAMIEWALHNATPVNYTAAHNAKVETQATVTRMRRASPRSAK